MPTLTIPSKILDSFKTVITSTQAFLKSSSIVVFVCGAKPDAKNPTGRDTLLSYAEKNLTQFQFLIAEKFFSYYQNSGKLDLLTIENQLAKFSDCIIIVLESSSTFAELGAFTNIKNLAKIILVVNDSRYKGVDSFITMGPLAKVNAISKFRPVIYANMESILIAAEDISQRLSTIERKRNSNVDISDYDKFANRDTKSKTLFLLDLIALFCPVSRLELIEILKWIYGDHNIDIHLELGLLAAFGLVGIDDDLYFRKRGDARLFFSLRGLNVVRFRSDIVNSYYKYSRSRLDILKRNLS